VELVAHGGTFIITPAGLESSCGTIARVFCPTGVVSGNAVFLPLSETCQFQVCRPSGQNAEGVRAGQPFAGVTRDSHAGAQLPSTKVTLVEENSSFGPAESVPRFVRAIAWARRVEPTPRRPEPMPAGCCNLRGRSWPDRTSP
jgi:hypothetical protein